jgi:hypothetical protein
MKYLIILILSTFLGAFAQNYGYVNKPASSDTTGILIYIKKNGVWATLSTVYKADSAQHNGIHSFTVLSSAFVKNTQPPQIVGSDLFGHIYSYNINNLVSSSMITSALGYTPAAASTISNTLPTRTLNSNFTISSQRARVYYPIRIAYSITTLLGSTGSATLQYSTNGGSSWISFPPVSNSLNLGLALTGYNDFVLSGDIPASALVRITTASSNATVTIRTEQQEILY